MFGGMIRKRGATTVGKQLEQIYSKLFIGTDYESAEFIPPDGFYTDIYIFGFTLGIANMHMSKGGGDRWQQNERGEYMIHVINTLDKNERDGMKDLLLNKEKLSEIAEKQDFIDGRLHGMIFGGLLLNTLKHNIKEVVLDEAYDLSQKSGMTVTEAFPIVSIWPYVKNKWGNN